MRKPLLLLFAALMASGAVAADLSVRMAYADVASPPYFWGNGSLIPEHPGAAVDLMREAAAACHLKPQLSRWPNKRLFAMLQADQIDISFMYSFHEDRMALFAYPMSGTQPDRRYRITSLVYSLYVLRNSPVQFDGQQILNLNNGLIGANTGWSIVEDLRNRGQNVEEAPTTEINFRKLQAGRIAAYATQDNVADHYLNASKLTTFVKLQPPLLRKDYFAVISHGWLKQHPQESNCLWQQIALLREQRLPALLNAAELFSP
ncbi:MULTISPECIES: ABC transporter substrate-binding protein [unclassified Paludibacterium]|uniref:substrate-binding periplasmic protein n=1 Tax=unclassified Paludibacterium TaxID=2618429 RepID=UPI001C054EF4|nr:transporter substrate-binding domain-containing protein [Paludibacterium sp. B53371]BEV73247.1 hypothetical protein THUN1379_27290 [Paludibacterium sp. THUN1379]